MAEKTTRSEAGLPRHRVNKRRWLPPATGTSAYRAETDGQQTSTSLSVIVPAYNEQYLVETSLERLKTLETSPLLHRVQVVVVNDGSKDSTAEAIAHFRDSVEPDRPDSKLQWTWLQHDKNQGKGADVAQQAGFQVDKILKFFNCPGVPSCWLNGKINETPHLRNGADSFAQLVDAPLSPDRSMASAPLSIIAILRKWDR